MAKSAAKKKAKKKAAKKKATKKKAKKKVAKKATKKKTSKKAAKKKTSKKVAKKKTAAKKKVSKKKTSRAAERKAFEIPTPPPEPIDPLIVAGRKRRSAMKRKAALAVVTSTSDRMAARAKTSVYAISSEKTLEQYDKIEARHEGIEAGRMDGLVDLDQVDEMALRPDMRRSARDQFGSFRNELSRAEDDPTDVHAPWRMANQRLRHELSPPAPVEELEAFEARIRKKLPPSYWDFCLEWNGGLTYVNQGGCYRIISPGQIMAEVRGPLCGRMARPYLPVVDLGCNDYLALDMAKTNKSRENPIYWWYAGEIKRKVADSFALWLKRLVEHNGAPYWWNL